MTAQTEVRTASVLAHVAMWPGVNTKANPHGATAIMFEGRELGHVHVDRATLDLPPPNRRRGELQDVLRAAEWFSGWVTKPLANDTDATHGLALLRESYDGLRVLLKDHDIPAPQAIAPMTDGQNKSKQSAPAK